ncbi:MAG: hypothetical protein ACOX15_08240 [Tepidanaerobacteraceae bacterium]
MVYLAYTLDPVGLICLSVKEELCYSRRLSSYKGKLLSALASDARRRIDSSKLRIWSSSSTIIVSIGFLMRVILILCSRRCFPELVNGC